MIRNVDVFFDNNIASAAIAYFPEVADASKSEGRNSYKRKGIINLVCSKIFRKT